MHLASDDASYASYACLCFQSENAGDLHHDIQRRDHSERRGEGVLAAGDSANDPGGGVSSADDGASVSAVSFTMDRVLTR